MTDPSLLAAAVLAQGPFAESRPPIVPPESPAPVTQLDAARSTLPLLEPQPNVRPDSIEPQPGPIFSPATAPPRVRRSLPPLTIRPLPTLSSPPVNADRVNADRVNADRVNASPATAGTVNASRINASQINASRVNSGRVNSGINHPANNSELYSQRLAALQAGKLYTRLPIDSFSESWQGATQTPTYNQWRHLLAAESRAVAGGQGSNRLSILVGDSLSLWYPSDRLPQHQLWLNQSISGETTRNILARLSDFASVRAQTIYVLAGVNDLKNGFSDAEILGNMQEIMRQLHADHPQAQIVVQSILPTQSPRIPNARIARLNQQLAAIAQATSVTFLNLHPEFADASDRLRPDLTTDGIHLTALGYATWQGLLQQTALLMARR